MRITRLSYSSSTLRVISLPSAAKTRPPLRRQASRSYWQGPISGCLRQRSPTPGANSIDVCRSSRARAADADVKRARRRGDRQRRRGRRIDRRSSDRRGRRGRRIRQGTSHDGGAGGFAGRRDRQRLALRGRRGARAKGERARSRPSVMRSGRIRRLRSSDMRLCSTAFARVLVEHRSTLCRRLSSPMTFQLRHRDLRKGVGASLDHRGARRSRRRNREGAGEPPAPARAPGAEPLQVEHGIFAILPLGCKR